MCHGRQLERCASGINLLEVPEKRASVTRPRFHKCVCLDFRDVKYVREPIRGVRL
jgi:hypothetical protein